MSVIDYRPAPTIKKFLASTSRETWLLGPVGGGKTVGALFKIAYHASRQKPSTRDKIRRSRAVVVRRTMPQLKDTTIASWFAWFKDGVAGKWFASENKFLLKFADVECEILFRPLDTPDDVQRVLSLEVTFAILDEFIQIPREIIEALSGRVGRYPSSMDGGPSWYGMWGASNVGNRTNWWYDYLFEQEADPIEIFNYAIDHGEAHPFSPNAKTGNKSVFVQPSGFSPEAENVSNLPNPNYYHELAEGKTRQWIRQFIECQWGFDVSGEIVFPSFNPDIHIKRLMPYKHLPLALGYDPGMNTAVTFGQHDGDGRMLIFGEVGGKGFGTERFFREAVIPALRTRFKGLQVYVVPDPASRSRSPSNEGTVIKELKRYGFEIRVPKTNLVRPRLDAVNSYLERIGPRGPSFLIDPSCRMTIEGLQGGYRYSERKRDDEDPEPEKNQWSHYVDTVQYLALDFRKGIEEQLAKRSTKPHIIRPSRNNYALGT